MVGYLKKVPDVSGTGIPSGPAVGSVSSCSLAFFIFSFFITFENNEVIPPAKKLTMFHIS